MNSKFYVFVRRVNVCMLMYICVQWDRVFLQEMHPQGFPAPILSVLDAIRVYSSLEFYSWCICFSVTGLPCRYVYGFGKPGDLYTYRMRLL